MSKDLPGHIGDPDSWYDRFIATLCAVAFQVAEIMLVVAAFRYAGAKADSPFLSGVASVLGLIGSLWLGLLLPGTFGRLGLWMKVPKRTREMAAILMFVASCYLSMLYVQAIDGIVVAQTATAT